MRAVESIGKGYILVEDHRSCHALETAVVLLRLTREHDEVMLALKKRNRTISVQPWSSFIGMQEETNIGMQKETNFAVSQFPFVAIRVA